MKIIDKLFNKMVNVSIPKVFKKPERKDSVIRDLMNDPDSFVLTMFVDNGEINVKIKKKEA